MSEIIIDKNAKQITFTNNGICFSQFGIANEVLDLIENQTKEIEKLHSIIKEVREYINKSSLGCDLDESETFFIKNDLLEILDKENNNG